MTLVLVSIHVEKTPPAFPLAAAILKTALNNNKKTVNLDVRLFEYYLPLDLQKTAEALVKTGAEYFGFSAATWNAAEAISIAGYIKNIKPEAVLFAGGPHATASADSFASAGFFDFILRGEGECIADVLHPYLSGEKQPGQFEIVDGKPFAFEGEPSPYPAFFGSREKSDGILWEVSRGCPYNCAFCYESRGNKKIRTIPEQRIIEELKLFRERQIEKIWVLDPTFNFKQEHTQSVLKLIIDYYPEAHYTFEIRAELMNESLCGLFSKLDVSLQIGLQTTNPEALKNINRSLNRQKFRDNCLMMSEYGLSYGIDLIYGLPGDDYTGFRESLDFAVSSVPNNIDIFPLSVLPGTSISEKSEEFGIIHSGFPAFEERQNNSFTAEDINKAERLTEACDLLYNREQAFSWFGTAAEAIETSPSGLLEQFSSYSDKNNIPGFITSLLRRKNKKSLIPVIESLIRWSRTAETAFAAPGKAFRVKLSHKPEILDILASMPAEDFIKKYPAGKERSYQIYFDGEELYIN